MPGDTSDWALGLYDPNVGGFDDAKADPFATSKLASKVGAAGALAGAAIGAKGALDYGAAAVATAKYNADLARREAGDAIARGVLPAFRARLASGVLFGRQQAAYGASGVLVGWGSPGDVTGETRIFSSIDEQVIRNNAAREAYMDQSRAVQAQMEGQIAEQQAKQQAEAAIIGGITKAASTLAPLIIDAL